MMKTKMKTIPRNAGLRDAQKKPVCGKMKEGCLSLGDEGDTYGYEENTLPDAQQDYATDGHLSLNSSDLNAEGESDVVATLVHTKNCLKKMNAELQETVDVTEDSNAILHSENSVLRKQVKG
ncbi:hypothetical protein AAFF_G00438580 [Aldrovandia affinis]|uniref:Uncharacterized protein n=1 Tax=Aldrovandia affinis TaxID=143900 RepID=A0AAD7S8C5_9TELE|nr:hypothetical protein AAFF_G00438580 [Aldrovandia affinis]